MDKKDQDLLKITEAAQFLGVARRTVYRRIWSGELPASKVGGLYFIRRADLEALLEKGRHPTPKKPPQAKTEPLKCGLCFRVIESDSQVGDLCQTEGCEKVICQACWGKGEKHCVQHLPDREEKWHKAQEAHQAGELSLLVKASHARLQEINFLNRVQTRIHQVSTLIHPRTEEVLTVEEWDEHRQTGDERARVMKLLGRMVLDKETTSQVPLNAWARWDLPPAKGQEGLPLRVTTHVLSRTEEMLRDGFDTHPLGEDELTRRLAQMGEEAETDQVVTLAALASTTGWDEAARRAIQGDSPGQAFTHRHLLIYLFDLRSGTLIYNLHDDRLRGYLELFTPTLPAEEIKEVIAAIKKEFITHDSLSLELAVETLPYARSVLHKAFERLAATGEYALTEVPEIGPALIRV